MLQVKKGDLDRLGVLFERYHRRLYSYFCRMNHRRDTSEDLVQTVFERILKYRHTFNNEYAFNTWIYRLARNVHIDHHRSANNGEVYNDDFDLDKMEGASADHLLEGEEDERLLMLNKALEKLDTDKKEPLVLSRYEGFKYREIAEIMNISEGTVKVRIYRAIKELKELIFDMQKQEL